MREKYRQWMSNLHRLKPRSLLLISVTHLTNLPLETMQTRGIFLKYLFCHLLHDLSNIYLKENRD